MEHTWWLQGMVDTKGHDAIMASARTVQRAARIGQWEDATDAWGDLETLIMSTTTVDFYNVLTRKPAGQWAAAASGAPRRTHPSLPSFASPAPCAPGRSDRAARAARAVRGSV